jgi:ABC-type metal ion transport system substrate-binding protein
MNYSQFNQFITDKYLRSDGTSNVDGTHHYELAQSSGNTYTKIEVYNNSALYTGDDDSYSNANVITNREYEEQQQEIKRKIRLLDPQYVQQFIEEYETLMKESII